MSAVTTVLSGGKPRKGKERAARSVLACDGREARPAPASEIHTPPSNTGVNNGVPQYEKAGAPLRARKTVGAFRSAHSGQFAQIGPHSDPELKADVLKLVEALDLVSPVLDFVLMGCVRDKMREQSVIFAQTLHWLSALRFAISAELQAVGISAPAAPTLESDRIKIGSKTKAVARSFGARP